MSWSASARGPVAQVRESIVKQLFQSEANYRQSAAQGNPVSEREADDIAYVRRSILEALGMFEKGMSNGTDYLDHVDVEAHGSRSNGSAYASVSFNVKQVAVAATVPAT